MDSQRFDALTRLWSTSGSRRQGLRALVGGVLAGAALVQRSHTASAVDCGNGFGCSDPYNCCTYASGVFGGCCLGPCCLSPNGASLTCCQGESFCCDGACCSNGQACHEGHCVSTCPDGLNICFNTCGTCLPPPDPPPLCAGDQISCGGSCIPPCPSGTALNGGTCACDPPSGKRCPKPRVCGKKCCGKNQRCVQRRCKRK